MAVRFQNAAMNMITVGKPGGEPIGKPTYHILSVCLMHAETRPVGRSEGGYKFRQSCGENTSTAGRHNYRSVLFIFSGSHRCWDLVRAASRKLKQ